jgi:predicted nuclease of restriction endonuclease-like RecB superfamily
MLTGNLLRVRFARGRIVPRYLDASDPSWLETAQSLLDVFGSHSGRTRGELTEEVHELTSGNSDALIYQGLAKLLEDRCEFETVSGRPPEELRELVFLAAASARRNRWIAPQPSTPVPANRTLDRRAVLEGVGAQTGISAEAVESGLFADLKSEQRLARFEDLSPERLLQRYNVALAQAVLFRATRVHVIVRGEPPQRYRQLFRRVKFHRLVCEIMKQEPEGYRLHLDGPLSLFTATQKYGLQLALFLPAVLLCQDFEVQADLLWGPQRKPRSFYVSPADGLVSHYVDTGMYVPPELGMFVELFRKRIADWEISETPEVRPMGESFWVPDFRLTERSTGRSVDLEVLGFWRRSNLERHLERLRLHIRQPFLLAVSEQLQIEKGELEGLAAQIYRFRQMPVPEEVVRMADGVARGAPPL